MVDEENVLLLRLGIELGCRRALQRVVVPERAHLDRSPLRVGDLRRPRDRLLLRSFECVVAGELFAGVGVGTVLDDPLACTNLNACRGRAELEGGAIAGLGPSEEILRERAILAQNRVPL